MPPSEGPRVAVVGDDALAAAVEDGGERSVESVAPTGDAAGAIAAAVVVAGGDEALAALAVGDVDAPVLAVGTATGIPSVDRSAVGAALRAALDGALGTTPRALYRVDVAGEPTATMVRDAALVTAEPARISEFVVHSHDRRVARFRADGVAVATPAGSQGYLGAAGGPVLEPGTGVLTAVPVAPFQTDSDHWVLDDAGVSLTVQREQPVELVVDGRDVERIPQDRAVELAPAGELVLYAVGAEWKNSNGRRSEWTP